MTIVRWGLLVALFVVASPAGAQSASVEVVVTEPAPSGTVVVPPPPPTSGGVVFVPVASAPAPSPVYVPSTGAYAPAEVPRERRVTDWAMVGSGIGMFAGGWLITWISTVIWYDRTTRCTSTGFLSYSCTHEGGPGGTGLAWSFLPVVGPWLMLTDEYLDTPGEIAFPIIAGLVQDVGLILMIVGLATSHTETVMVEARRAGDVRFSGGATPDGVFGSLDAVF